MSVRDAYDDSLSLREARQLYFVTNGFGADGGYEKAWVDVKVGPLAARIPNTKSRKRAVRVHDLHHTLTGYRTTFRGECEISGWEVASGCADHWAAWFLNLSAMGAGLLFAAGDVWRAFLLGRETRNLYRATFDEALLDRRLGAVRHDLGLTAPPRPARASDRVAFAAWALAAMALFGVQLVATPVVLPVLAFASRTRRRRHP